MCSAGRRGSPLRARPVFVGAQAPGHQARQAQHRRVAHQPLALPHIRQHHHEVCGQMGECRWRRLEGLSGGGLERLLDGQWEVEAARECWGVVPSKQLQQCSPATPACTHLPGPAPAPACAACAAPAVSESLSPAPWPSHRRPLRSSQAAGRGSLREGGSGREQWQGAVAGSSGRGQEQSAAMVCAKTAAGTCSPDPQQFPASTCPSSHPPYAAAAPPLSAPPLAPAAARCAAGSA